MKIKGKGRFNRYLSEKISAYNKRTFIKHHLRLIERVCNRSNNTKDVTIIGFSGEKYFYEQIYSALSFIEHVGKPAKWYIVNDGSYTEAQIATLQKIPSVEVVNFDFINVGFDGLKRLAEKHIWGKIFYAYFNILNEIKNTTIYLEADVLVFEGMKNYWHLFEEHNYYLSDTDIHLDTYYLQNNKAPMMPVNNGFALFNKRPPLEIPYNYMMDRVASKNFEYFTPQSAFQLLIEKDINARFLDPRYFVVNCSDHFKIGIDHLPGKKVNQMYPAAMALRHFVGPVRQKMWQTDWHMVLGSIV